MTKIGVAILGVGRWGVHLVRNFCHHPQAKIVAIVDFHQERLASCQARFDLDDSVVMATEWNSVRKLPEIDVVVVATPASTHYNLIADALKLGYHVLAEKPLTLDPAQCVELTQLAEQKGLQLLVDHTYLFHAAVQKGCEVIQSGEIGELRYGYASRTHLGPVRQDVDALWDLAIHDIAIFNSWLGQIPIKVEARGRVWLQKERTMVLPNAQAAKPGLDDLVWVTLTYPQGFEAQIHLCWFNPDKQRRLVAVGAQGSLIFDEMSPDAPLVLQRGCFEQKGERFIPSDLARQVVAVPKTEPLGEVCDRFLADILSGSSSTLSSGWIGAELVQTLSCLSQSLQQGKAVAVPPLQF